MSKPNIHVAICTPAYGGQLTTIYTNSLLQTLDLFRTHNIKCSPLFLNNESLVQRGRNTLVAQALAIPDVTHVLFIDADIQWAAQSILRLLQKDVDIVGGIYPHKHYCFERLTDPNLHYQIQTELSAWKELEEMGGRTGIDDVVMSQKLRSFLLKFNLVFPKNTEQARIQKGFVQVERIATGMMLIKRKVFESMMKAHPDWHYIPNTVPHQKEIERLSPFNYAFFDCKIDEHKQYLSEDWYFCSEWKKLGGEVWADITMPLSHGGFHVFSGSVSDTIVSFKTRLDQAKAQTQATNTFVQSKPVPVQNTQEDPIAALIKEADEMRKQQTEPVSKPVSKPVEQAEVEKVKSIGKKIMNDIDTQEKSVKSQFDIQMSKFQEAMKKKTEARQKLAKNLEITKGLVDSLPILQAAVKARSDSRRESEKRLQNAIQQEKKSLSEMKELEVKLENEKKEKEVLKKKLDELDSEERQLKQNVEKGKKILEQFPEQRKIAREMEAEQIAKLATSTSETYETTESKVEEDDPIARLIREAEEAALKGEAM